MREILFRGKRTDNGEWAEGDLYRKTDALGEKETIIFQDKGADAFKKNFVNSETVGQYTGLKDKNGKKIFEGDIVRQTFEGHDSNPYWPSDFCGFIVGTVFMTGHGTFIRPSYGELYDDEEKVEDFKPRRKQIAAYRSEVIGNIFDNPELLERSEA